MCSSILIDIKNALPVEPSDTAFDGPIIMHINSALNVLREVGCGNQETPFFITGNDETWEDFLGSESKMLMLAREFIYADVKLIFDPPTSQTMMDALKRTRDEDLWRINHEYEISTPIGG